MEADFQKKYRNYSFKGKRQDEEIILLLRRHWLILLSKFAPVLFFLVVLVGFHFFGKIALDLVSIANSDTLLGLVESFMYMFLWSSIFITWIDFYFDVWIVTNQRIINIEQLGLFRREISELDHVKIQDVTSEIKGVIPTFFNFGYVYIQTAAEKERFIFKQVSDPVRVRNIIMQLQQRAILEEKKKEGEIMRGKI